MNAYQITKLNRPCCSWNLISCQLYRKKHRRKELEKSWKLLRRISLIFKRWRLSYSCVIIKWEQGVHCSHCELPKRLLEEKCSLKVDQLNQCTRWSSLKCLFCTPRLCTLNENKIIIDCLWRIVFIETYTFGYCASSKKITANLF